MSLLYNGSRYGGARGDPRVCSCAISTSDCDSPARLKFRAVDLRLHSYNDITSCKTHSRVSLQDTVTSQSLRCQRDYFQKGFRDLFYSSSPYARMSLYNQPGVYPTQVWLEVTGKVTLLSPGGKSSQSVSLTLMKLTYSLTFKDSISLHKVKDLTCYNSFLKIILFTIIPL